MLYRAFVTAVIILSFIIRYIFSAQFLFAKTHLGYLLHFLSKDFIFVDIYKHQTKIAKHIVINDKITVAM